MTFYGVRPRPILGALTALLSVTSGFVLVFRLLTPGTLDRIPTPVLLGVLALLALPILAVWVVIAERSASRRAAQLQHAQGVVLDVSGLDGLDDGDLSLDVEPATQFSTSAHAQDPAPVSTPAERQRTRRMVRARRFPAVHARPA